MSVDRYRPHLLVIPEDDANRQLANGFIKKLQRPRQIHPQRVARGWLNAIGLLEDMELDRFPDRNILLLIDFDDQADNRLAFCRQRIPEQHVGRVFILGVRSEPENLKRALPGWTLEDIGGALADECRTDHWDKWNHELLACNAPECARLRAALPGFFA